ncbi:MAG: glycosyltransferase family 39 protein [Gemmatimonadaceae bacterium]
MSVTRRERAQLFGLWLGLAALRWLAALPVRQPRIFRDELLHWQLAQSFVSHRPFLVSGEVVDYPALLYPALLSLGLHIGDAHLAFQVAHALNALMVSAVVFAGYALARELGGHREALAAAALAGLAPGGVYSVFIMEENLYYPLFVASCWLCWRMLVQGRVRDAAWCAAALSLTYFAKPLALPLAVAYVAVLVLWATTQLRVEERNTRARIAAVAVRLAPAAAFLVVLLVRHALTARGVDASQSGVVLGRFYTDELGGALVPPIKPMARVTLSLAIALALGVGIAPAVALLGSWREQRDDSRRLWLALLAVGVTAIYVLAAARHTMVINPVPKIHERYIFAVGPMFLALFITAKRPLGVAPIVAAFVLIAAILARIAETTLPSNTWVNAPSLLLPWLVYTKSSRLVAGLLVGAGAAVVCYATRSRVRMHGALRFGVLAGAIVLLNVAWYAFIYHIQANLAPVERSVRRLEMLPADARITTVVPAHADPMAALSSYGKFWLGDRVTVYWTGTARPPWYVDVSGAASDVVARTKPTYLVGLAGLQALCPAGSVLPDFEASDRLSVQVVAVPTTGCAPPAR